MHKVEFDSKIQVLHTYTHQILWSNDFDEIRR